MSEARDDERDAVAELIDDAVLQESGKSVGLLASGRVADAILAAGYRKHPEPEVTDEMIRAAREVLDDPHDDWSAEGYWDRMARAVLEAALRVPVGEGEQG